MKAIVSLRLPSGKWAEVGMNFRTVIGPYKRENLIRKHARTFSDNQPHRLEWFSDAPGVLLGDPWRTEEVEPLASSPAS